MATGEASISERISEQDSPKLIDFSNNEQKASFIYNRLLIYILLQLPQNENSKQELFDKMISSTSQGIDYSKSVSEKFRKEYKKDDAIMWYTQPSFIYRNLNQAMREQNIEFLYSLRHFLIDFYQQLQENQLKDVDIKRELYRGVSLEESDVEKLVESKGTLIHFDQFLSTSKDANVAKAFIGKPKPGQKAVLYHIFIGDEAKSATDLAPITSIETFSENTSEKEVLFGPSHVFRLKKVEQITEKLRNTTREIIVYHVYLALTHERDLKLNEVYQKLKSELYIDEKKPTNVVHLAKLLRRLCEFELAIKYYKTAMYDPALCRTLHDKILIHTDLALIYRQQKKYDDAAKLLDDAIAEAKEAGVPEREQAVRTMIDNRGIVYKYQQQYVKALQCFRKTLCLQEEDKIGLCQERATTLNNLACLSSDIHEPELALSIFEQVLSIQNKVLPEYHYEKARTYNNMSCCYKSLGNLKEAEEYANKALNIKSQILPEDHRSLATTQSNLGIVQLASGNTDAAYNNLESARDILTKDKNPKDPELIKIIEEISKIRF